MLVLSRKVNEVINLGEDITLKVVEIRPSSVRLGINAPRKITVNRSEVAIRIANGEPLHEIEEDLDWRENQKD